MKQSNFLILLLSILIFTQARGQKSSELDVTTTTFAWTPSTKHTRVNGLAVGLNAKPWRDSVAIQINGMNLEMGPMGLVIGLWGTMYGLIGHNDASGQRISFFSKYGFDSLDTIPLYSTHLNGFSFSMFGLLETYNKGLFINGLAGDSYQMKGVQVSGLINHTSELQGASIALLSNTATKAKGLQIGLINKCLSGNIVQIGLFNRIGSRVMPFVNFSFKKEKSLSSEMVK